MLCQLLLRLDIVQLFTINPCNTVPPVYTSADRLVLERLEQIRRVIDRQGSGIGVKRILAALVKDVRYFSTSFWASR
jgi:hypothetical protein